MTEWQVFGVIVALFGFVVAVVTPILKLNTSITKLTVTMESMSKDLINDREKSRDAHKSIWAGIDAVEKKNTEQDLTLSNHEQRIKVLEKG